MENQHIVKILCLKFAFSLSTFYFRDVTIYEKYFSQKHKWKSEKLEKKNTTTNDSFPGDKNEKWKTENENLKWKLKK